jgi:hypothetical protein
MSIQGGQQEDAEEFLGFYLDTLEEELLAIHNSLSPQAAPKVEEAPAQDSAWMEVGKKNKMVVTRAVSTCLCLALLAPGAQCQFRRRVLRVLSHGFLEASSGPLFVLHIKRTR